MNPWGGIPTTQEKTLELLRSASTRIRFRYERQKIPNDSNINKTDVSFPVPREDSLKVGRLGLSVSLQSHEGPGIFLPPATTLLSLRLLLFLHGPIWLHDLLACCPHSNHEKRKGPNLEPTLWTLCCQHPRVWNCVPGHSKCQENELGTHLLRKKGRRASEAQ